MKKVLILLSLTSLVAMTACKKEKQGEILKVGISFEKDTKNQKIAVLRDSDGAYINWTSSDKIKLVNSSTFNATLTYKNVNSDGTANFTLPEGTNLSNGTSYTAFFPSTVVPSSPFTTPTYYEIDPSNLDAYLNANLLMYTKTPYIHGTSEKIELTPAMTILELSLKADSGTLIIDDITLIAHNAAGGIINNAFIKKATLSKSSPPTLSSLTYTNRTTHIFTTPLVLGTTAQTMKLLVWSNTAITPAYFSVNINGEGTSTSAFYYTKKTNAATTPTLSNSKYYTLTTLTLPTPQIGDFYQGGYVYGTPGCTDNPTNNYFILAKSYSSTTMYWCDNMNANLLALSTPRLVGDGKTNTDTIISTFAAEDESAHAANHCVSYRAYTAYSYREFNDWFLPSEHEIVKLPGVNHSYHTLSLLITGSYWSSSKNSGTIRVCKSSPDTVTVSGITYRNSLFRVYPMRSF